MSTLVKACVWARKVLRKEALASSARGKPYVIVLIEEDIFSETFFSQTVVDRIKSICGIQQSFGNIVAPHKSSNHRASHNSSRFFSRKTFLLGTIFGVSFLSLP